MPFKVNKHLETDNQSSVPTPEAGIVRLYSKDDKNLYILDEDGTESLVGGGGGTTANSADIERNEKNIMINALRNASDAELTKTNMIDGFIDVYSDQTGIVAADSSGYVYVSAGDYYTNDDDSTKLLMHFDNEAGLEAALYLDGTGDYLELQDSADWDITTDWTMDLWVKHTDHAGTEYYVQQRQDAGNSWGLFHVSGNGLRFQLQKSSTTYNVGYGGEIADTNWHHIAVVRKSGQYWGLYRDGEQVAYLDDTVNDTLSANLIIGQWNSGSYFDGYMRNLRISQTNTFGANPVVGVTDTIDVPYATPTPSGVDVLLAKFDEAVGTRPGTVDETGKNVMPVADVHLEKYKYNQTAGFFDGTDDYLQIADHADWDIVGSSSQDYTIDMWVKFDTLSTDQCLIAQYQGGADFWNINFRGSISNELDFAVWNGGEQVRMNANTNAITDSEWHHIVLCKVTSGGPTVEWGFYVDGVQIDYVSDAYTDTYISDLYVGQNGGSSNYVHGHIKELRVQKSNIFSAAPVVGLTDTITVPTAQYTADSNTALLLHSDAENYGQVLGSCLELNGSNQYLTVPDSTDWDIWTDNDEDATIDLWVKHDTHTGENLYVSQYQDSSNFWGVYRSDAGGGIRIYGYNSGVKLDLTGDDIADSTWHHVAYVKKSAGGGNAEYAIYLDGKQTCYAITPLSMLALSAPLYLGQLGDGTLYFDGKMKNVRVSDNNEFGAAPVVGLTDTIDVPANGPDPSGNTKLLLRFDGDPTPNSFVDSGDTGHLVTSYGYIYADEEKVFGDSSAHFEGTADDLIRIPDSSDWDFGTGDFTIEFWLRYDTHQWSRFCECGVYSVAGFGVQHVTGGNLAVELNNSTYTWAWTTTAADIWYHVAVCRSSGTIRAFIDGKEIGTGQTASESLAPSSEGLGIGGWTSLTNRQLKGWIDEFRISDSARYTTDFAVPSSAFTSDANTKLLLHFDKKFLPFKDSAYSASPSGHFVTPVNEPSEMWVDEYRSGYFKDDGNTGHTPAHVGAKIDWITVFGEGVSTYDGTGDEFTVTHSDEFDFGTNDFTVDCWAKFDLDPGSQRGLFAQSDGASEIWKLNFHHTNGMEFYAGGSNTWTFTPVPNDWYHFLVSRTGTDLDLFINGKSQGVITNSTDLTGAKDLQIGRAVNNMWEGDLDELRIVKGTATQSSSFTPPSGQYSAQASGLLCHFDATDISDSSNNDHYILGFGDSVQVNEENWAAQGYWVDSSNQQHIISQVGDVRPVTAVFEGNRTAAYFDGDSDYIQAPNSADWNLGTDDFTIEFWYYTDAIKTNQAVMTTHQDGNNTGWDIRLSNANVQFIKGNNTGWYGATDSPIKAKTWQHIAFVRSSGTASLYINGLLNTSTTDVYDLQADDNVFEIGTIFVDNHTSSYFLNGYIKEVRISKGIARYTEDFTPPTEPFVSDSYTKLLLHMDAYNNSVLNSAAWFDGTSDCYLIVPYDGGEFDFGTGDFTMEAWYRWDGVADDFIFASSEASTPSMLSLKPQPSANNIEVSASGVNQTYSVPAEISDSWYHVAAVRTSGTVRVYLNGIESSSGGQTIDGSVELSADLWIGKKNTIADYFNGFMKNLRISDVARYSSDFIPPTGDFTSDANTVLLLPFNSEPTPNNFTDVSDSEHNIYGGLDAVNSSTIKKFGNTSAEFDGADGYLYCVDDTDWDIGTNWTAECWMRVHELAGGDQALMSHYQDGSYHWEFYFDGSNSIKAIFKDTGTGLDITGFQTGSVITTATDFYHVAVIKVGSDWGLYVNGVQGDYDTDSNLATNVTSPMVIGNRNGESKEFGGWIDEARITQGNPYNASPNVGVTDTFTAPTEALTADSNTVFLTHFENAYKPFEDASPNSLDLINSTVQIKYEEDYRNRLFIDDGDTGHVFTAYATAKVDWLSVAGDGSAFFDGTTDYLTADDSDDWTLGDECTIEGWVKPDVNNATMALCGQQVNNANWWGCGYYNSDRFWMAEQVSDVYQIQTYFQRSTLKDTWLHVAYVRHNSQWDIYINGKKTGVTRSGNSASITNIAADLDIGLFSGDNNYQMNGNMDDLKLTKNKAHYINSFVPSSGALTSASDFGIVSASGVAQTAPASGQILITPEDVYASGVLNTDFKAYVSRDDGTTWTQATLTRDGAYTTDIDIVSGYAPLGAQPSGVQMKYKIEISDLTKYNVHGTSLLWK